MTIKQPKWKGPVIRWWVALPCLVAFAVAAVITSDRYATAATKEPPPQVWGVQQCTKCHTNPRTLKAMTDKAGDKRFCLPGQAELKSSGAKQKY